MSTKKIQFMVCVRCMTFNQSSYIEDALNGFTMQETNFPFVCTILDDASTDGEQEVIKKYLQEHFDMENKSVVRNEETDDYVLTFAQNKLNKNCYFAVLYLKYNHYSNKEIKERKFTYIAEWHDNAKYIALCEGDDYWTHPQKLQMQVDFLESHPDYTMYLHNALKRFQNSVAPDRLMSDFVTGDIDTKTLFEKWQLPLASVVFRRTIIDSKEYKELSKKVHGGFLYFLTSTKVGKVYGLSKCLSVYRKNLGGVSNTLTPSYCLLCECNYAKASEDKGAIIVMREKATKRLAPYIPKLIRRDAEAMNMVKVAWDYNHYVVFKSIIRYLLFIMPVRIIKKMGKND